MAVSVWTRRWAVEMGGNAVFADLQPGDRFHFPKHPERVFKKRPGGWYWAVLPTGLGAGPCYRTGSGTAVVKLEDK